jgi:putative molybdopterin biosynthesis protein
VEHRLRFSGSHDAAVAWLANHAGEVLPGVEFQAAFSGSLGGLMALAEGRADLAGCHLWDPETNTYNLPFVQRLFPRASMALVRLANRRLGWILPPGNPRQVTRLEDIAQPGLRFVNRQRGSGTRVWLDEALARQAIRPDAVAGYSDEKMTHTEAAQWVAAGRADLALGLESAAADFGLDFVFLVEESYDLVIPAAAWETAAIQALVNWLASPASRQQMAAWAGYEPRHSGAVQWV